MEGERGVIQVKCAPKQWPLFSAPGLSSMRVVGYKEKGGTMYFTVMAILEGFKWKVDRTYDDFAQLQRVLMRLYGMDHPVLPSYKKMFSFFGSTKPNEIEEMKRKLEAFVMSAVTSFPVPPTDLLKFVEYPFTDVLSVTQALAKFFYVEGEIVLSNDKAVQMSPLQLHCINKRMTLPLASSESGKMEEDFGHLLDFLQNLRKLKIAPPTEEHASANLDTLTFDLNLMKSLEVLLVESIQVAQLQARYSLPSQLLKLEVRRSLKLMQEILVVYPSSDVDHSPAVPGSMPLVFSSTQALDLSQAMPWEKLQQANFKLNGIKKIDESVKLLPALERLDLSFNYIEEIEYLIELPHLRVLDVSHNKITRLTELHTRLGNITKLGLSSNNLVKLNGIQKMVSIQYLDLSNNQISDASEVHHLDPLPCLEKLFLKGNPITQSLSYRSQVFSNLLHHAEQVALDGNLPTKDELMVSIGTPTTDHKRAFHVPDIRPDNEEANKPEELEEMEVGMGTGVMTTHLEELRKEGGDKWLSILNAEKAKDDTDVVASKSPRTPKKKKTRHTHSHTHHKPKTKKQPEMAPQLGVSEESLSFKLAELITEAQEAPMPSTVNFEVTMLEYRNSAFLSLSPGDLDQLLQNTPLEECVFSIDTLICKAIEVDLASSSNRVVRDLRLIYHIKIHEGKRLAVCLRLPSSRSGSLGGSRWLLYSVQKLSDLARLYAALKTSMARSRSVSPDRPLMDILNSIKSDASDGSLTSSGATPIRQRSECETTEYPLFPAAAGGTEGGPVQSPPNTGGSGGGDSLVGSVELSFHSKPSLEASEDFTSISYEDLVRDSAPSGTESSAGGLKTDASGLSAELFPATTDSNFTAQRCVVPVVGVADASTHTPDKAAKSNSPSVNSPLDSLSPNSGVLSPQHQHGLESSSTSSQGDRDQADGGSTGKLASVSAASKLQSRSPVERKKDKSLEPPPSSSKASSTNSSRAGSGTNTPRTQKPVLVSPKEAARHSPAVQGTPPVGGKPKRPPQDFPAAVFARLESIVSPDVSLPSPLYSQDQDKAEESEEEEREAQQMDSIYDPVVAVPERESDNNVVQEAVMMSAPDAPDSRLGRRRDRRDPKTAAPRTIIAKPGLDDNNLRMFFKKIIADESSEILMNVTWGVCNLPSAPSCEIEVGTMISDKGVYLLEVLDPENHTSRPLSWTSENLPLAKITCCYHHTLSKLSIGIFDQSLTVESFEKGLVNRFVFFPHTYEKLNMFVENLKAACDAHQIPYTIISFEQGIVGSSAKGLTIHNPDADDMARLKANLVWSKSRAVVGNSSALNVQSTLKSDADALTESYEIGVRKLTLDSVDKFEIVQYVIVGELSCDVLPISDGKLHVQSRALILTNDTIYLCKEELDSWPYASASIRAPPFPRCTVLDAHPIARISGIRVCDKSHPIVSFTDPLYEFAISFEELDDICLSPTLSAEWILCVHDRQYLDQLLKCLIHLSNELQRENHKQVVIKHTSSQLMTPGTPKPPKTDRLGSVHSRKEVGAKKGSVSSFRGTAPCFFSSTVLFEFSILTNYQRLKFFKKHVAQAEFLKSDEVPLSVFLAHCSSTLLEYVEVEVCVVVSNYAIYLLSDVDSVQQWVEMGGVSSFLRRNLLDRKNSEQVRCFYRLWLNEMKQVDVGLFYDCVSITDVKEPQSCRFTIHSENPAATLSFLSALSYVVDLHDTAEEKEMDTLLSDYDLMDDTVKLEPKKTKNAHKQPCVEFVYHGEEKMGALKRAMVSISPAVAKGIPKEKSAGSLKILYQQVVLLVEELRIRDILTSRFYPHLVFLTNYGVYVCLNETSEKCSPAVMDPSKLSVKKWCHIDLLERLHVTSPCASQYSCYNVVVYLRNVGKSLLSSEDSNSLSLLIQNSELLGTFLYHFSLMYHEKCGKQITIVKTKK